MSRKTDIQSGAMLGVYAGCFHHLVLHRYYAKVETQNLCKAAVMQTMQTISDWPFESDDNLEMASAIVHNWGNELEATQKIFPGVEIVFIASCLLADLQSVVNSPYKKKLLAPLNQFVHTMEEFVDPTLGNIPAYDNANRMLNMLYAAIEWNPPKKKRRK